MSSETRTELQKPKGRPMMTTWEYRVVPVNDRSSEIDKEAILNLMGADGWELVAVVQRSGSTPAGPMLYFKRSIGNHHV